MIPIFQTGVPLNDSDPVQIMQFYHQIEDLCVLRRTSASQLPLDLERTRTLDLAKEMEKYQVTSVNLRFTKEEAFEQQYLHREAAWYAVPIF